MNINLFNIDSPETEQKGGLILEILSLEGDHLVSKLPHLRMFIKFQEQGLHVTCPFDRITKQEVQVQPVLARR